MDETPTPGVQPGLSPDKSSLKERIIEHKRALIITGGIVTVILLIAAILAALLRGPGTTEPEAADIQQSRPTPELTGGDLPTAQETESLTQPASPDEITPPSQSQEETTRRKSSTVRPTGEENLAVIVKYTRTDQFTISIEDIRRTGGRQTTDLYNPAPGAPYSLVRVMGDNGSIIAEEKFTMATQISADGIGTQGGTVPLRESTARLVFPVKGQAKPVTVVLLDPQGITITRRDFTYSDLPADPTASPLSLERPWLKSVATRLVWSARAQGGGGTLKLVVINEMKDGLDDQGNPTEEDQWPDSYDIPALLNRIKSEAEYMKETIEPWRTYKDQVEVVTQFNQNKDLGCIKVETRGNAFPGCPDDAKVISAVENIYGITDWDGIIVAYPIDCNCGAVKAVLPAPHIVGVGMQANYELLVHQFGHAIGDMGDEYLYQYGNTIGLGVANCFPDEQSCLTAIQGLPPGAQCSPGCETVSTWRPATRIMHNNYDPLVFGPLEECIMGEKIAEILGMTHPCERGPGESPGTYWGWHK